MQGLDQPELDLWHWQGRTILAVGILHRDFSTSESEQITAVDLDAATVRSCAGKRPLGNPPVACHEVTCVAPVGVWKS